MAMKKSSVSGGEHYGQIYRDQLRLEAEWLRRGAAEKVNSVEALLRANGIRPESLLELGCGTGAVISECRRRGLAEKYHAVDYSQEAIEYLKNNSDGIHALAADITSPDFSLSERFDVVVLSHVLEHLKNPASFLQSVQSLNFSYLIVEVPLEDLFFGKVKSVVRDRTRNLSGHVQFFTATSLTRMLASAGFEVLAKRRYVPVGDRETMRFVAAKNRSGKARYYQQLLTGVFLPTVIRPVWSALYYAHYAVLCRKAEAPESE
ncbi:MAG: class I SAM-dependent methyltransferase [Acidobacteriota bacterium]|nr:class I SAM-dependent methyltransferase [Acidobacteriota bacterium]